MDLKSEDCPMCRSHREEYAKMMKGLPFILSWVRKSKCPLCGTPWGLKDREQEVASEEPEQVSFADWGCSDG